LCWRGARRGVHPPGIALTRRSRPANRPFECGKDPLSLPTGRLSIRFYLTAILFILFDVELVFLYPWAVVPRSRYVGPGRGVIFLGVLMAGFFYAWDNGALE
jgi:NADH-quinone oxidoreductase subunit A